MLLLQAEGYITRLSPAGPDGGVDILAGQGLMGFGRITVYCGLKAGVPIGQVFFVPREEITLRDCTEEEVSAIWRSREEYFHEKAALRRTTNYGLEYSPLYSRRSGPEKR